MPSNLTTRIQSIQTQIGVPTSGTLDLLTCGALEKLGNLNVSAVKLMAHIKAVQKMVLADPDGFVGPETVTKIEAFISTVLPKIPAGASLAVSAKSLNMIIEFEVSSKEQYMLQYQTPTWPGGDSGVTIGIGYDLGYYSAQQITDAWSTYVTPAHLQLLLSVKGKKAAVAKAALAGVKQVKISYDSAAAVFYANTLPDFARQVKSIYPAADKLPPDAQGALLSLVYNRGASLTGDRRIEMKNIVPLVTQKNLTAIAVEIRKMKRLWTVKGLIRRREAEAQMVESASFNILPQNIIMV